MFNLIKRLWAAQRNATKALRAAVGPVVETLEDRRLLDAVLGNGEE
jgi:hypothetical protein